MFTKVYFYCDHQGNPLGTYENDVEVPEDEFDDEDEEERYVAKNRGHFTEKPFILHAKHCNARHFYLNSAEKRWERGTVPAVHLCRSLGPLSQDPYNEDGRPPTLLLTIAMPHIQFLSGTIEIMGIEDANLCWGGWMVEPYTHNYKPLKGVKYMPRKKMDHGYLKNFHQLNRQRIVLAP
jgi:hypothetical protein